jgi:hypothetical protein
VKHDGWDITRKTKHSYGGLNENVKRRALFRYLNLDGTIMLNLKFEKQLVMWTGLKWLRIGLYYSLWRITVSWPRKKPVIKLVVWPIH